MFQSREFEGKLEILINQYSVENLSDTPDYILARYLMNCLESFNIAVGARTSHSLGQEPRA